MTRKERIFTIIFGTDTKAGRQFDVALLWIIVLSVLIVVLESVKEFQLLKPDLLYIIEWAFTILFTLEYALRVYSHPKPFRYIFSFYGIIDLLAILPSYAGLFFSGTHYLLVIRTLRLLRVFRILKLGRHLKEGQMLLNAVKGSVHKITVFFGAVLTISLIMGTTMYMIEGEENGFDSIPQSIYWAIVTITTVGYGDMAPVTALGKFIASVSMIVGYCIIAVPTGIFVVELDKSTKKATENPYEGICSHCGQERHLKESKYCHECGEKFDQPDPPPQSKIDTEPNNKT